MTSFKRTPEEHAVREKQCAEHLAGLIATLDQALAIARIRQEGPTPGEVRVELLSSIPEEVTAEEILEEVVEELEEDLTKEEKAEPELSEKEKAIAEIKARLVELEKAQE